MDPFALDVLQGCHYLRSTSENMAVREISPAGADWQPVAAATPKVIRACCAIAFGATEGLHCKPLPAVICLCMVKRDLHRGIWSDIFEA